jgi:hypothetical protein
MLHETFHAVDLVLGGTPYLEPSVAELTGRSGAATAFTDGVWRNYGTPVSSCDFTGRDSLRFYNISGPAGLPASQIPRMYRDLMKTPFVSLYGSVNWAEDFADYQTWYYLKERTGMVPVVRIRKRNTIMMIFEPELPRTYF